MTPLFFARRFFIRRTQEPALLFDFDGVIADSFDAYFGAFTEVCSEMGFDRINSRESFLALFDGNLFVRLVRSGFPMTRLRELAERFRPRIEKANLHVLPFPGMPQTLNRLAAKHPLHIITSNHTEIVQAFLERHGISGARSVIGADIETSKIKKIRNAMRAEPRNIPYYMGDTRGDMVEARRAGAKPVGIAWGWHDANRVASGKPWRLVHTPEELEKLFP